MIWLNLDPTRRIMKPYAGNITFAGSDGLTVIVLLIKVITCFYYLEGVKADLSADSASFDPWRAGRGASVGCGRKGAESKKCNRYQITQDENRNSYCVEKRLTGPKAG